jgi:hypothetical protein
MLSTEAQMSLAGSRNRMLFKVARTQWECEVAVAKGAAGS